MLERCIVAGCNRPWCHFDGSLRLIAVYIHDEKVEFYAPFCVFHRSLDFHPTDEHPHGVYLRPFSVAEMRCLTRYRNAAPTEWCAVPDCKRTLFPYTTLFRSRKSVV